MLRGWTMRCYAVPAARGLLEKLAQTCDENWREVLTGEASSGPGNDVDLVYDACGNADGTLWPPQVRSVFDELEGVRDLAADRDDDRQIELPSDAGVFELSLD